LARPANSTKVSLFSECSNHAHVHMHMRSTCVDWITCMLNAPSLEAYLPRSELEGTAHGLSANLSCIQVDCDSPCRPFHVHLQTACLPHARWHVAGITDWQGSGRVEGLRPFLQGLKRCCFTDSTSGSSGSRRAPASGASLDRQEQPSFQFGGSQRMWVLLRLSWKLDSIPHPIAVGATPPRKDSSRGVHQGRRRRDLQSPPPSIVQGREGVLYWGKDRGSNQEGVSSRISGRLPFEHVSFGV